MSNRLTRRPTLLALLLPVVVWANASPSLEALETAPSLPQLLQQLQASGAQLSTHLLLDAPDVAAPGAVTVRLRSELPGSNLMVLVRGAFNPQAQTTSQPVGPPAHLSTRRVAGEVTPKDRLPRPVWLGSFPIKAGKPAAAQLQVELDRTQTLSLFVHAQGRWWFVSREIKIGRPITQAPAVDSRTSPASQNASSPLLP